MHSRDPPTRRPRDPPSVTPPKSPPKNGRKHHVHVRDQQQQVHHNNTARKPPLRPAQAYAPARAQAQSPYLLDASNSQHVNVPKNYSSSHQHHQHQQNYYQQPRSHNDNAIARDHNHRQTLRRRGSSTDSANINGGNDHGNGNGNGSSSYYRHEAYGNGGGGSGGRTIENFTPRRSNHNHASTTTTTAKSVSLFASRLARIIVLVLVCILTLWGSLWGIGTSISLARGAMNIIFGHEEESSYEYATAKQSQEQEQEYESISGSKDSFQSNSGGLRGASDAQNVTSQTESQSSEGLSAHDINALSHMLKAEGRQIINDRPMEEDKEGEGDKAYMGKDSTNDFFYAGAVDETKRIVNTKGKSEIISYPAHAYAVLPVSLDAKPFAVSIWIYLAPLEGDEERDSRRPRVIFSTRTEGYDRGCQSFTFGDKPAVGIVLYAQPHYGDTIAEGDDEVNTYRVMLEYSQAENKVCRTLSGSSEKMLLVREGEWHHVALFATRTSKGEGDERISLYVNGDLAGRIDHEKRRFSSSSESKTTVGRYVTGGRDAAQSGSEPDPTNNNFGLGGRLGMLSFWETGGHATFTKKSKQIMKIESESDEDHIVRAINRAGFDMRAIQELSLQGLAIQEPALLYTFDGQNKNNSIMHDLYSDESPGLIKEAMVGRSGTIMSYLEHDMLLYEREPFIPLGGNRYYEYKDGTFEPPALKEAERKELDEIAQARKGMVKKAMKHAWKGYRDYAYGKDELLPLSNAGQDNWGGMGTTLVDSLSTLWLMGMKQEFWEARDWVRDHLDFSQVEGGVSVFETTIRNLGGLLSAYDFSGDKVFLEKADDLGMRLMRAFESRTGIPYGQVELFDGGRSYNTGWHSNEAVLSEIGTLQVEFRYLAKVTGKSEYATNVMRALDEVLKLDADHGLYPTFIHNTKQDIGFGNSDISMGAMGDSFYEYLLKIWLQGGKSEVKYRRLYDKSVNGIMDKLVHKSRPNYLTYVAELKNGHVVHKMDHLACFLGGMLALGAYTHPDGLESVIAQKQLRTGKQLAYTCYQMYARSQSGLSPEYVKFDNAREDFVKGHAPYYILRPETAETFFILYHLTKDPVYREWGWEVFQAIEEHCRTDAGYAAIRDVDTMRQDNRMESFFLAETLKYLHLLQDDSTEIDLLNTHVFNTEAHPLRLLSLA